MEKGFGKAVLEYKQLMKCGSVEELISMFNREYQHKTDSELAKACLKLVRKWFKDTRKKKQKKYPDGTLFSSFECIPIDNHYYSFKKYGKKNFVGCKQFNFASYNFNQPLLIPHINNIITQNFYPIKLNITQNELLYYGFSELILSGEITSSDYYRPINEIYEYREEAYTKQSDYEQGGNNESTIFNQVIFHIKFADEELSEEERLKYQIQNYLFELKVCLDKIFPDNINSFSEVYLSDIQKPIKQMLYTFLNFLAALNKPKKVHIYRTMIHLTEMDKSSPYLIARFIEEVENYISEIEKIADNICSENLSASLENLENQTTGLYKNLFVQ